MKRNAKYLSLLIFAATALWSCNTTTSSTPKSGDKIGAGDTGHEYWALNFASGGNTTMPLYVYRNNQLVAFVESYNQQTFLGHYNSSDSNGTYNIVVPNSSSSTGYYGCSFTINGKTVNSSSSSQCIGLVDNANPPGNEHIITWGANLLPAIEAPTPGPTPYVYPPRTITIKNNTDVVMKITITGTSEHCPELPLGPDKATSVNPGASQIYNIADAGATSCNFELDSPISGPRDSSILPPATYNFRTLLEITYPAVNDTANAANVDMSMVNGFNVKYKMYPLNNFPQAGYFTYNSGVATTQQKVSYYSSTNLASRFSPDVSLKSLCDSISAAMPASSFSGGSVFHTYSGTFEAQNTSGTFIGCFSQLSMAMDYLTSGTPDPQTEAAQMYGCQGPYATPATCTTAATGAYVNMIHDDPNTIHGYAYPFDDWYADYGMNRHTSLVWEVNSFN